MLALAAIMRRCAAAISGRRSSKVLGTPVGICGSLMATISGLVAQAKGQRTHTHPVALFSNAKRSRRGSDGLVEDRAVAVQAAQLDVIIGQLCDQRETGVLEI